MKNFWLPAIQVLVLEDTIEELPYTNECINIYQPIKMSHKAVLW